MRLDFPTSHEHIPRLMSARADFGDRSKIEGGRLRANATRAVRVVSALGLLLLFGCGGDDGIGVDDAGGIVGTPGPSNPLMNPAAFDEPAPEVFRARFETSKGDFVIEVHRDWAPIGADQFFNLVKNGYYDDVRFFRVLDGFVAQFGMHGDPFVNQAWENHPIPDDPVTRSNLRGFVTFAKSSAPDSRTTQVFINFVDNSHLDDAGFAPFGQVEEGMDVVDQLFSGYGDTPVQQNIATRGNDYLTAGFPNLDYVQQASIVLPAMGGL